MAAVPPWDSWYFLGRRQAWRRVSGRRSSLRMMAVQDEAESSERQRLACCLSRK